MNIHVGTQTITINLKTLSILIYALKQTNLRRESLFKKCKRFIVQEKGAIQLDFKIFHQPRTTKQWTILELSLTY